MIAAVPRAVLCMARWIAVVGIFLKNVSMFSTASPGMSVGWLSCAVG